MNEESSRGCLDMITLELVNCQKCPRLVAWREEVAATKRRAYVDQEYWGRPVPGFGDPKASLLVVGLAPGAHGSNRTGRMFTGDASGDFLYPALYRAGFASQPQTLHRDDGLELHDLFISAICRCAPPDNKPTPAEIRSCSPWLEAEMACLGHLKGIVALGRVAMDGVLELPAYRKVSRKDVVFGHGAFFQLSEGLPWLLCSYHPSRQNTQTGRLTAEMFDWIWQQASTLLRG
ncbi:MAG: uracil-DNA glycosylase [Anaerolineaceae bacterium]